MDDRIKVLARTLDLSAAQQSQVKTILEQGRQQMIQNRLNTSISGSARIDQFRALQDQTIERIRAILTEEQKRKYDLLAARKLQQQATPPDVDAWLDATRPQQTN